MNKPVAVCGKVLQVGRISDKVLFKVLANNSSTPGRSYCTTVLSERHCLPNYDQRNIIIVQL